MAEILSPLNEGQVFQFKMRPSAIFAQYFVIFLVLLLATFPFVARGHLVFLVIVLAAIGIFFFLVRRTYGSLAIGPESLLIGQGVTRRNLRWSDIADITMLGEGKRRRLGLRLFGRTRFSDVFRHLSRMLGGYQIVIHDVYERDIGEIEKALRHYWQEKESIGR